MKITETRKKIIEHIEPFMNKTLSEGCIVHLDESTSYEISFYKIKDCDEISYNEPVRIKDLDQNGEIDFSGNDIEIHLQSCYDRPYKIGKYGMDEFIKYFTCEQAIAVREEKLEEFIINLKLGTKK